MSFLPKKEPEKAQTRLKKFGEDFEGSWGAYKRYLVSHGALSDALSVSNMPDARPAPAPQKRTGVPWACMDWSSMSEDLRGQCITHIGHMVLDKHVGETKAREYIKYLQHWCGAPGNLEGLVFA